MWSLSLWDEGNSIIPHCISKFMREKGRNQKWEEKWPCWVQSLLLNLMTNMKIPLSRMPSPCALSEFHSDNRLKKNPFSLLNNYLKWKVTKLCGILRYSRTYYKPHTWLNDRWKNTPRKMVQSSNIAEDGKGTEDHQERALCGTLFCINNCIYNLDQVSRNHSAPFLPGRNMSGFFNNTHQKSGDILHSNNRSSGVKENHKISSFLTHFVITVICLDYSFTMCELWELSPACVWTVMTGLNNNKKESGVLSLLWECKGFETERNTYSLVQRKM